MIKLAFDKKIQNIPSTKILYKVEFNTCNSKSLFIILCKLNEHTFDNGIATDAWWLIRTDGSDRYCRLFKGKQSFEAFITKYGHMDEEFCVHKSSGMAYIVDISTVTHYNEPLTINKEHSMIKGVSQRTKFSGICWYASMCFVMFGNKNLKKLIVKYAKKQKDFKMEQYADQALNDDAISEKLRKHLYNKYKLGDKPGQDEELDGQNGFNEFTILISELKIPMIRYLAPNTEITSWSITKGDKPQNVKPISVYKDEDPVLFAVRCFHTKHRPARILGYKTRLFKLVGAFIGSEECGHQIGMAINDDDISIADSDARFHGIGPMMWKAEQRKDETKDEYKVRWWNLFQTNIPITVTSRSMCDLSPVNRKTKLVQSTQQKIHKGDKYNFAGDNCPGVVNVDYIYISQPNQLRSNLR